MRALPSKSNTRAKLRWGVFGIAGLLCIAGAFSAPNMLNRAIAAVNARTHVGIPSVPVTPFSLGLDLQGGAYLVYDTDTRHVPAGDRAEAVEGVRDVIERRVTGLGVGEPNVQTSRVGDAHRIVVELPGVTDVKRAIDMIGATPILEFKEENKEPPRDLTPEENKQMDEYNADAKKRANAALARVQKGESFEAVAREVSEDTATKNNGGYLKFLSERYMYPELFSWAKSAKEGAISRTGIETPDGYSIVKRGGVREGEKEVKASHILICYLGSKNCEQKRSKSEALSLVKELYDKANEKNFSDLAKEHTDDPTGKLSGGDLGYFTAAQMVKPFSDAAFAAKPGDIVGPVESEFGYHVIYKTTERAQTEYELWRILIRTKKKEDIVPPPSEWKLTGLSGKQLERAQVVTDPQTGEVQVSLQFNQEGAELFRAITERNLDKTVAIFLDSEPISTPRVNQIIPNGQAVITGGFSLNEARMLSQRLNAGALPVPVSLISQHTVGATLGADSLAKSLRAGILALLLVMVFMVLYYRFPGTIAVVGLLMYAALSAAIFKLLHVTLSLAGIAGFILSIGMAVDANILVFERMKEELRAGRSLKGAVEEGFLRAWSSIRDGNSSVFITCAILIWFGSSFVKGFAVTLALGTLVSVFTAITVTRTLLRFTIPWFPEHANRLFLGWKRPAKE